MCCLVGVSLSLFENDFESTSLLIHRSVFSFVAIEKDAEVIHSITGSQYLKRSVVQCCHEDHAELCMHYRSLWDKLQYSYCTPRPSNKGMTRQGVRFPALYS